MSSLERDLIVMRLNRVMNWCSSHFDISVLKECCSILGEDIIDFYLYNQMAQANLVDFNQLSEEGAAELKGYIRGCVLWAMSEDVLDEHLEYITEAVEWM